MLPLLLCAFVFSLPRGFIVVVVLLLFAAAVAAAAAAAASSSMKLLALALLLAASASGYVDNKPLEKEKIVGGQYHVITDAPYTAQLLHLGTVICGATIVTEQWLVSAAHCFEEPYDMAILTGSTYRGKGQRHTIDKVIIHRNYDVVTNDNDICLIKLKRPMVFSNKQKAIALSKERPRPGQQIVISGYGLEGERKSVSPFLKIASAPIVEQRSCARKYLRDPITDNMFCAGIGESDACLGDSGGPGVIAGKLAGVVSSGMECASRIYPGVYTRVDKYYGWIANYTGIAEPKARG